MAGDGLGDETIGAPDAGAGWRDTRPAERGLAGGTAGTPGPMAPRRAPAHVSRTDAGWVAALAGVAAFAAIGVSRSLFPRYSANRDENVYVQFGELLARGRVTLPPSRSPFRPWASGVVDGRIVMKYTPPWPAVIGAARAVSGTPRLALALSAAAATLAVYVLAREVVERRSSAVVATAIAVASPLFVVQSGTYLPYLFGLALCAGACAGLLAALRREGSAPAAVAGVLASLAFFARPFDAAVTIGPFALLVAVRAWRDAKPHARRAAGAFVLGALPGLLAAGAYDWYTMGSPLRLPFTVTGSSDGFGFGRRGVFDSSTVPFRFGDGLAGLGTNLRWLPSWTFGGVVTLGLALWGASCAFRRGRPAEARVLASWLVLVPVALVPFWGAWAMSHNWPGVQLLGPFYHLPVLVPIAVFGADRLVALFVRSRPLGALTVVAMLALTAVAIPDKVDANRRRTDEYARAERAVDTAVAGATAVVFLPYRGDSGFLDLLPSRTNPPDLDQRVLYAEDRGRDADLALLAAFPGRRGYVLDYTAPDGGRPAAYEVRPL